MTNTDKRKELNKFLYPVHNYRGEFTPNNFATEGLSRNQITLDIKTVET